MHPQQPAPDDAPIIALFAEHRQALGGFFMYRLRVSHAEAEELAQETYRRLIGQARQKEIDGWPQLLWRIARNLLNDKIKQRKDRQEASTRLQFETVDYQTPESLSMEQELMDAFKSAVDELPQRERDVLAGANEGKSFTQLARELDVNERTCRRDFQDAITKVQRQIGLGRDA